MKIAVLLGGTSMERDVSVASGTQVISALRSVGHKVIVVESSRGVLSTTEERELLACGINTEPPRNMEDTEGWLPVLANKLQMAEVDLVFLALHGGWGEDGTIQAVFEKVGSRRIAQNSRLMRYDWNASTVKFFFPYRLV